MLNGPPKFETILKKLKFHEILGLLSKFWLELIIYTFMVWECMKFTRETRFRLQA